MLPLAWGGNFFFLSIGERNGFWVGSGNGEGFSSVAWLPWESPCSFVRESFSAVSVVEPAGGVLGIGMKQTPWKEGWWIYVTSLMLLLTGHHLGLLRLPGVLEYLN